MSKYVPVKLTPDAALNREALGEEVMESIAMLEGKLGCKLKLQNVSVKQGSECAQRVTRAHQKFEEQQEK